MSELVNPVTTNAWSRLNELAKIPDFRAEFSRDPQRAERLSWQAGDLFVDLSKSYLNDEIVAALCELAEQTGVLKRRDAMYHGVHINNTEDRAVLHTALRRPATDTLVVDGQDCVADVREVLERVYAFAHAVRSGQWKGVTGKAIETVVNIGIGGSDLGPVMAYEALRPYAEGGPECRFISNIDPTDVGETLRGLNPETTLFIVASKTFTTLETMTNAGACRTWLLGELEKKGVQSEGAIARHFVAVSTNLEEVARFGIDPHNAFGFWNWVGGRYSVDSAIGTVLAIAIGPDNFEDFLHGFHIMDRHFAETEPENNVPLLMGLLNILYVNFFDAPTHAVLPYSQFLHRFPAYLQQLTMESNGKSVCFDGSAVTTKTGEVFWGEPGTNGQHAFYQLIHQGTQIVPADFIAFANPTYALNDGLNDQHELFLGNFFAQTRALAFGKTAEEVRAEGTAEEFVTHRVFPGNRPTASIIAPALTPSVLGQLIALYEHITFVQGAVWGINSFDQWGVELGKQMAKELAPAIAGDAAALQKQDASTRQLISYYRAHRNRETL
ncbi:MAG: glucose-6-phosphate isomerase [Actinomycetaceae bacterium]|nr:glucose-6-phosphate isomerase [Actinomycetaceae bacterium]